MSRKRGTQHRRRPRRGSAHVGVGIIAAWCATETALDEARKVTHDQLLETMGNHRTSGVAWRWTVGVDQGNELIDQLIDPNDPPELSNHYRRLRAKLREEGGHIVVAMAEGRMP